MEPGVLARMEAAKTLFRRCVQCPPGRAICPATCPDGQKCSYQAGSCDACASTSCVAADTGDADAAPSTSGSAGPVAGGVIGGIVVIAVIVFLVWRFCIRNRQREYRSSHLQDYNMGSEKDFGALNSRSARQSRQSRQSVASVASTAYTRASNFIPIAYIPGVTNRSVHSSQDLVPPVPPIPAASPTASSPQLEGEDSHYFLPKDLHENYGDRQSMARNSIASTIYRNNAIVSPIPAQMGTRAKPMAVSVRSGKNGNGSPVLSRSNTPPLPTNKPTDPQQSSIVGRRAQAKPVQIFKSSSLKHSQASPTSDGVFELDGSGSEAHELDGSGNNTPRAFSIPSETMSPNLDGGDSDDEHSAVGKRLVAPSKTVKLSQLTSTDYDLNSPGVFATRDLSAERKVEQKKSTASLNQIIEAAAMNASRDPTHRGLAGSSADEANPFSDGHAAVTP